MDTNAKLTRFVTALFILLSALTVAAGCVEIERRTLRTITGEDTPAVYISNRDGGKILHILGMEFELK